MIVAGKKFDTLSHQTKMYTYVYIFSQPPQVPRSNPRLTQRLIFLSFYDYLCALNLKPQPPTLLFSYITYHFISYYRFV